MSKKQEATRMVLLGLLAAGAFLFFIGQLMTIQIVEGESYKAKVTKGATTKRTVSAVRGEIVDRYGRPMTANRVSYDVVIDRAYLPYGEENQVLYRLIRLMEQLGHGWIDNLPITMEQPYRFLENQESAVSRLKRAIGVNEYATAEECIRWLADKKFYDLESFEPDDIRKLAGVRYEMIQNAFSLENTYTFSRDIGELARDTILEHGYELSGVTVVESPIRGYTDGTLAPHILGTIGPIYREEMDSLREKGLWWSKDNLQGYRGTDQIGKSGVEYSFESTLRGTNGVRQITIDGKGKVSEVVDLTPAEPGHTVMLTLDIDLQRAAQKGLEETIVSLRSNDTLRHDQGHDVDAGAVVAMNPKTGEILAMATYPSYNIETYTEDYSNLVSQKPEPLLNRATMGLYRPGSTYKPVVAAAGLQEGVITADETILCNHIYTRFEDYRPQCMHYDGDINVVTALQRSCNIFFYETGWRLGIDRMNAYSARFGLGSKTGIEIQEAAGHLSSPETRAAVGELWTAGNVIQSAIGQLDHAFTPVQMATYVSALANNGVRMQPHLVKAIKSYDFQQTVYETPIEVADTVPASQEVFDVVRQGMIAATSTGGTSNWLWKGFPLTVASKTGTPEGNATLSSCYICYIPAEDPEIAIAVVLEHGGQGYTGAPVARAIAEEFFFGDSGMEQAEPLNTLLP